MGGKLKNTGFIQIDQSDAREKSQYTEQGQYRPPLSMFLNDHEIFWKAAFSFLPYLQP